ncbi:MAG: nuclear transport factor 2 family protein [Proteobacteria bacterium]|jgi:ketosteroid isomerase-like protein|nr:nuclear transport factor 2 family protein [Pseudomonadota bacterium]
MVTARTPPIFTSPQDAAVAFYRAFEARDIDALMATWADDEDVVCVHPGGVRHVGYDAVRAGFEHLFSSGGQLHFRLEQIVTIETVGLAMQSAIEQLQAGDDGAHGVAIATNVLMRTPSGWRLVCHHASPAPAVAEMPLTGPLH